MNYLKQRGLDQRIAHYKLGFAPAGWDHLLNHFSKNTADLVKGGMLITRDQGGHYDRFRNRIMFPIHNRKGDCIAFGGRVLDDSTPKYLNSPETPLFQKSRELYGLHQVLTEHRDIPDITIVEGYMDVLALAQHGQTRCVATLGTATTSQHLDVLFRYTNTVIFCFDGDKAGRTAAWRALAHTLQSLRDGRQARFVFLPQGEDPDSYIRNNGQAAWQQALSDADSVGSFLFKHLRAENDTQSIEGRARFAGQAIPLIKTVSSPMLQDLLTAELAKITRIDERNLQTQLKSSDDVSPDWQRMQRQSTKTRSHKQRLDPATLACAYLLQHPPLHSHIPQTEWLLELGTASARMLCDILECIKEAPNSTTAHILQHYSDHPGLEMLKSLAWHELLCPEDGIEEEFTDLLSQLRKGAQDNQITQLMQKAAESSLTAAEKTLLQTLMRNKKHYKNNKLEEKP